MSVELMYGHEEGIHKTYRSPQELLAQDATARRVYQDFIDTYVGDLQDPDRLRSGLPPIVRELPGWRQQEYLQEMFTGFSGLGDLVHIRVDPQMVDHGFGYFVVRANLHTAVSEEVELRTLDKFYDPQRGWQTLFYLNDEHCEEWPQEYQPMIHFEQASFRFTYKPGFGQGESLLRPIEGLVLPESETVPIPRPASEPMGRRALELVRLPE